jgi:hypothetical protein
MPGDGGSERASDGEGGRHGGAPVTNWCLRLPVQSWMLMDDWPYGDHPEPAVLRSTLRVSTLHLWYPCRHATCTMAADVVESQAGSFTGGAAAADARVGIRRRSSAV